MGGNVPYGYTLDPEKGLVINEEEALIIRKMFQMYTFGKEGSSAICKQLNEAGNRNRNGRKWGRRVVLYMLRNPVYVGKIRWREVTYEGHHDPVVSEILFEKAQEVLKARHEELKGRQFHTGDERLLTGVMKYAKCNSHMFGTSGTKNGFLRPYYVCSKRFNYHECEQDYVRDDLLEAAIIEDIKSIFRDEQFMARLWAEANKLLGAEKPDLEKEIARIDGQMAKTQGTIDRYFEAFEAETLKAELCNEKVRNLRARMEELEREKRSLEARRERLELPAIDKEMLRSLLDNFEKVMAEGPNPKKSTFSAGW